ncbi:MAG: pyruvate:ferredoxin (flavodoxin) oxidoreductase [Clostridia bacterium]|nr:pyruvate:ferredoxin (flavodoxin) oxidoreductase [Clostridia bacterium]
MKKINKITVDGNTATARIAYYLSEVASIYPITPSSTMAELCEAWSNEGKTNINGKTLLIKEMQSEAGAASALHGSLACGALSTTFTASQGLLLMIPNMYKIAGELLPSVFHVSARALATHALSIFGDHSDVMSTRSTGFALLCSANVQECQDMALASHIATLETSVPFVHFFDGFRTSHEIQKIDAIDEDDIKKIYPYDKVAQFKSRALDPLHPHQQGTAQNPDIFFQNREACNSHYFNVYDNVVKTFDKIESITGRKYSPFEYYGADDATSVIVIMGSGSDTAIETAKKLNSLGHKVGVVRVRLYRPFNSNAFVNCLPKTVKKIAVLDRTKESGAPCEPLCQDVIYAVNQANRNILVIGGRYGLGSKEFLPKHVYSVYQNLSCSTPKNNFTVGIKDDVTHLSLEDSDFVLENNQKEYKFFGLGSDGTVGANKNTIKIIGETTNKYVQGYFEYDSKKSGSLTTSHLRVSDEPICSPYALEHADIIAIHNFSFVERYDLTQNLRQNGIVILNTVLDTTEVGKFLPEKFVNDLKTANAKLYIINAQKIAEEVGLGSKINVVMQTAFFKLAIIIDYSVAKEKMQDAIKKTYGKKGEEVVNKNLKAIDFAENALFECNVSKLTTLNNASILVKDTDQKYYNDFIKPIENLRGNDLPVSSFDPSGYVPTDTSKYLKRGIASHLPCWDKNNCIQCGMCVIACPHSVIHSKLIDEENLTNSPTSFETANAFGVAGKKFKLQISPLDCTGCGVCQKVCPARNKALTMTPADDILNIERDNYEYFKVLPDQTSPFSDSMPKGLQFKKSYFEFSGACAGCGETPYIKLASTLFGKNMIIANATGCSSIYGGNSPVCPYSKDANGKGPAWANSLFEDNAEFGLGMSLAVEYNIETLKSDVNKYLKDCINMQKSEYLNRWLSNGYVLEEDEADSLIKLLLEEENELTLNNKTTSAYLNNLRALLERKDYFTKKSIWIIGGDGWAYDIGYGGLDHVLASKHNVNILVLDSEVYSNTGGQASKSTQKGATAKFASNGKQTKKKDLAQMAMAYSNAYVAQVSLGADMAQTIKAFKEAESYNGVSIIIAYAPCVNHGFDMSNSNAEMKKAVECGYWNTFRYNPSKETPLEIDSLQPDFSKYKDFLLGESRYKALYKTNPQQAEELFAQSEQEAKERRKRLENLLNLQQH